ncbi:hypothetical protein QFZ27_004180 [Inquilinus ginsengisoli]|uniref:hypothetical protein n=1 Tax=Inquilinus ginsengisoli TaxID=363840 RepID=UPI003D1C051A
MGPQEPEEVAAERIGYIVGSAKRLPTIDAILVLFGDREVGDLLVVPRLRRSF